MNGALPLERVGCPVCGAGPDAAPIAAEGADYEYETSPQRFRFLRCADCDLLYLSPRPATGALDRIYPTDYYSFGEERDGAGLVGRLRRRWELRKAGDYAGLLGPGPRRILDVGCGRGALLSRLREIGGPVWELHGIDLDAGAVESALARGFVAVRSTVESYAPARKFDLIVLQQVIEHVADPVRVTEKLKELLVPGGALVLETPDLDGWDYRLFRRGVWGGYHFPRHWTLFSRASLRRLVERAGLRTRSQASLLSLSFWSWSLHHLALRQRPPRALQRLLRPPSLPLLLLTAPLEILQRLLGAASSNQRIVAVRPEA